MKSDKAASENPYQPPNHLSDEATDNRSTSLPSCVRSERIISEVVWGITASGAVYGFLFSFAIVLLSIETPDLSIFFVSSLAATAVGGFVACLAALLVVPSLHLATELLFGQRIRWTGVMIKRFTMLCGATVGGGVLGLIMLPIVITDLTNHSSELTLHLVAWIGALLLGCFCSRLFVCRFTRAGDQVWQQTEVSSEA